MNLLYLIAVEICILLLMVLIKFFSDRSKNYQILSMMCLLPTAILEFPHTLLPDPTNLIDIGVHIAGGITIFIIITNVKLIPEESRDVSALVIVIGFIILLEVFQIVLKLVADIGGPISLDVLEDIFLTVAGGFIGLFISRFYFRFEKKAKPL